MTNSNANSPLHPLEKSILEALVRHNGKSIEELAMATRLGIDQIRRGIEWLKLKGLIHLDEVSSVSLGTSGYLAIKQGLPERRLVDYFRYAKQNNWIVQQRDSVGEKRLVRMLAADNKSNEEKLLNKLKEQENLKMSDLTSEELNTFNSLKSRDPGYVREHKLPNETTVTLLDAGNVALPAVADVDMKAAVLAERRF